MAKSSPDVVAMLEAWLLDAKAGLVTGIYVLGHDRRGEWVDGYNVNDAADLALELRTARFRVFADLSRTIKEH